uniref:Axonemal dynein light intermediate polypeptide 1 n=1 Tax=Hucho hucho TaxID=62062 RepID=A0A4W5MJH7_9TELE
MIPPADSLLKYDNPVLVSRNTEKKARPLNVAPQQPAMTGPVPPPPKPKTPSADANKQQTEEILNEQLDLKLKQRQARETGICPVHRELYSQCFGISVGLICVRVGLIDLENEKRDLERQVNEQKAKCEEKKHTEEIQFLKRTNQQLKVKALTNRTADETVGLHN